jgi:hypothetical protein
MTPLGDQRASICNHLLRDTGADRTTNRRVLVQPHFSEAPFPPPALVEVYGVNAQILAPILDGEALVGWVSVHSTHPARGPTTTWRQPSGP